MTVTKILCGCAFFVAVATASAQMKHSISGTCPSDVEQSVPAGDQPGTSRGPAGDQPGHTFMVAQGKCSAKDDIGTR
jgi:hypothetical protein